MAKYFLFQFREFQDPDAFDSHPYEDPHLFLNFVDALLFSLNRWLSTPPHHRNFEMFQISYVESDSEFFKDDGRPCVPEDAYYEVLFDFVRAQNLSIFYI